MSQRCLISFRKNITGEDGFYDCVYDENGSLEILLKDWLACSPGGFYLGPWRLNIRDKELFEKFMKDFNQIKNYCSGLSCLDDLWLLAVDGVCVSVNDPPWWQDMVKALEAQGQ